MPSPVTFSVVIFELIKILFSSFVGYHIGARSERKKQKASRISDMRDLLNETGKLAVSYWKTAGPDIPTETEIVINLQRLINDTQYTSGLSCPQNIQDKMMELWEESTGGYFQTASRAIDNLRSRRIFNIVKRLDEQFSRMYSE